MVSYINAHHVALFRAADQAKVAGDQSTPPHVLSSLEELEISVTAMVALAKNPSTPVDKLERLAQSERPRVAAAAIRNLSLPIWSAYRHLAMAGPFGGVRSIMMAHSASARPDASAKLLRECAKIIAQAKDVDQERSASTLRRVGAHRHADVGDLGLTLSCFHRKTAALLPVFIGALRDQGKDEELREIVSSAAVLSPDEKVRETLIALPECSAEAAVFAALL